jgi:DNA-directed RNA polymerase specialized sigma24 family protein
MAKKRNYVNNPDLLQAIIDYQEAIAVAASEDKKKPIVPDYIGNCILMISKRLATKPNFSGYTYKEDMISDGIENCLQYMHNFKPEKSNNPFAYFTQIIWFAFLRRIAKEKKQMYIRFKASQNMAEMLSVTDSNDVEIYTNEAPAYISEFIRDYEAKLLSKKIAAEEAEITANKESNIID